LPRYCTCFRCTSICRYVSGIVGGIIVSLISGSQLGVSGPAAGLTTVVSASILASGDYRVFMLSVIIAGLFQLLLGVLKLGTIANYFPSAVIKGMLAAIGIILIAKQIPVALGYDQPDFWSSGFLNFFSTKNFYGSIHNFNVHTTRGAILISIVSTGIIILLQQPFAKKIKILPSALLVVIIAIIINMLFTKAASVYSLKQTQLVNIPKTFSTIYPSLIFQNYFQVVISGRTIYNRIARYTGNFTLCRSD